MSSLGENKRTNMTDLIAVALHAPFRSFDEATAHLEQTALLAGVRHLSYWFLNFHGETNDDVVWISTYDPQYMSDYMNNFTPLGDPAIEDLLDQDKIIDWQEWKRNDPTCADLHTMAKNYGITEYGTSIAFRDLNMGTVVFSVNVDSTDAEWNTQRALITERFQPFAHLFHERMRTLLLVAQKDNSTISLCA